MRTKKESPTTGVARQQQHNEDTNFQVQLKTVYQSFFEKPQTMKEVDVSTGIMRENICWHCRELRKKEQLFPIKKRYCRVTKHRATEWTTNPELIPISPQLNLFPDDQTI